MTRFASYVIAFEIAAIGIWTAASAAEDPLVVEARRGIHVSYADLNLANPAGVARLEGRVRAAARELCSIGEGTQPLKSKMSGRDCYGEAIEGGNAQIRLAVARSNNSLFAAREGIVVASRR